jgi:hypothetical protein
LDSSSREEVGCGLVQQKYDGRIGKSASQRDSLCFAAREIGHVPRCIAAWSNSGQQFFSLWRRELFTALPRPKADVLIHRPRKKEWALGYHAGFPAKLPWRDFTIIDVLEKYGSGRRLVQAVQKT